uniref:Glycosyltransferase family 2 protein n=1 Tax=Brugia timori TaxID=42155 RepID=A0A0R3QFM9_9BILA
LIYFSYFSIEEWLVLFLKFIYSLKKKKKNEMY